MSRVSSGDSRVLTASAMSLSAKSAQQRRRVERWSKAAETARDGGRSSGAHLRCLLLHAVLARYLGGTFRAPTPPPPRCTAAAMRPAAVTLPGTAEILAWQAEHAQTSERRPGRKRIQLMPVGPVTEDCVRSRFCRCSPSERLHASIGCLRNCRTGRLPVRDELLLAYV